jgi:hypothetical protein
VCGLDDARDAAPLHVHAAHEDCVAPREVGVCRRTDVLVDNAHLPSARQVGGDEEEALRRHERADAGQEVVRVLERPERRCVGREDAEDPS